MMTALCVEAGSLQPRTLKTLVKGATNFSADLNGPQDTRESTWGTADFVIVKITFTPPPGYRVRLLHVRGDVVAWPRVLPGERAVQEEAYAGFLFGLQTTGPEVNPHADYMADSTMLYVQGAVDSRPARIALDDPVDTLLESDNVLLEKVASWLNTTEHCIHLEPTLVMTYQFEKLPD